MWQLIKPALSPKGFAQLSINLLPWLFFLFCLSLTYGLSGALIFAPPDAIQSDGFRIIYVHVPCALLSLIIYCAITLAAITALVWRIKLAFLVIRHSLPLGISFTLLALITGSLWGKPMWGTWWIWDARLTSELILLFLYLGVYLFQVAAARKPSLERACALLIIVGSIDLPIIHFSVYWWNTLHQGATLRLFGPSTIDTTMLYPLLAMIAAFALYYAMTLLLRISNEIFTQRQPHAKHVY